MEKLESLDKIIRNAANGRHQLAAIDIDCYNHYQVLGSEALGAKMLTKFIDIITEEYNNLKSQFESL